VDYPAGESQESINGRPDQFSPESRSLRIRGASGQTLEKVSNELSAGHARAPPRSRALW